MKHLVLAFAMGVCAVSGAQAESYICALKEKGSSGWIASVVLFKHTANQPEAEVMDRVIKSRLGKPVTAKVVANNAKRLTLRWEIKAARSQSNQYARELVYKLSLLKGNGKAQLSMQPSGFPNRFYGIGTCKPAE